MKEEQAKQAATTLRNAGWDVVAQQSPIGIRGWKLIGTAADGGAPVYGFSHNDMKCLILGGQVATIPKETL